MAQKLKKHTLVLRLRLMEDIIVYNLVTRRHKQSVFHCARGGRVQYMFITYSYFVFYLLCSCFRRRTAP